MLSSSSFHSSPCIVLTCLPQITQPFKNDTMNKDAINNQHHCRTTIPKTSDRNSYLSNETPPLTPSFQSQQHPFQVSKFPVATTIRNNNQQQPTLKQSIAPRQIWYDSVANHSSTLFKSPSFRTQQQSATALKRSVEP